MSLSPKQKSLVAPLRRLGPVASGDEVLEGAEGDHVFREQRVRSREIDRPDTLGQAVKPLLDAGEVVGIGF